MLDRLWLCRFPSQILGSMGLEWGRLGGIEVEISTEASWVFLPSTESPLQAVLYIVQESREIVYVILTRSSVSRGTLGGDILLIS